MTTGRINQIALAPPIIVGQRFLADKKNLSNALHVKDCAI